VADDARSEARRRFAEELLKASHADSCMEPLYVRESEVLADAVLELFPEVDWDGIAVPGEGDPQSWIFRRRLRLTGPVELDPDNPDPLPVEPVVPEEPQP
jgi:hypothetical protein